MAVVRPRPPVRPARPRRRAALHRPRPRAAQPVRQRPGPSARSGRVAVVKHLAASLELPGGRRLQPRRPDGARSGIGDGDAPADLFDRTFNGRFAEIERAVVRGSGVRRAGPPAATGRSPAPVTSSHPATRSSAGGSSGALGLSEADLGEVVQPVPAATTAPCGRPSPFDEETGPAALSLLHRVSTLTCALEHRPRPSCSPCSTP